MAPRILVQFLGDSMPWTHLPLKPSSNDLLLGRTYLLYRLRAKTGVRTRRSLRNELGIIGKPTRCPQFCVSLGTSHLPGSALVGHCLTSINKSVETLPPLAIAFGIMVWTMAFSYAHSTQGAQVTARHTSIDTVDSRYSDPYETTAKWRLCQMALYNKNCDIGCQLKNSSA